MQSTVIVKWILSVRPSVTFRYCVQTNEDTIVWFLPRCMECGRGLAMRILSVKRVLCDKTVEISVQIFYTVR